MALGSNLTLSGYGTRAQRISALERMLAMMKRPKPTTAPMSRGGPLGGATLGLGGFEGSNPSGVPTSNPGAVGQVTGFDPGLVATGLGFLGIADPTGIGKSAQSVMGLAGMMGMMPDANLSVNTTEGPVPAAVVGPTGMLGLMGSVIGLNESPVTVAVGPHNELSAVPTAAVNAGWVDTTSLTAHPGDAPTGVGAVPSAGQSTGHGQEAGPTDGAGGGGGGGGSHLCGALYRRGRLTREDLAANELFRRRMTKDEYAGYSMWAQPLVRFADAHPRLGAVLAATLGRLALLYMKEIRTPGSSRVGRWLLRGGLSVCRWLGARRAARLVPAGRSPGR